MRRVLKIENFEDLERELEHLEQAEKIETSGVWSFYQILLHISNFIHYSMHGYPVMLPAIFRKTIGRFYFKRLMKKGVMEPGGYNPSTPKIREDGGIKPVLQKCKEVINDFKIFEGEFAPHPVFDKLDKSTWEKFHSIHASLHLSFVHPEYREVEIIPAEESVSQEEEKPIEKAKTKKEKKVSKKKLPLTKKKVVKGKKKTPVKKKITKKKVAKKR
ncbi:MAG: DUF1569 domain-containing protein [Leptospiraceae bacterium]|nr:DUF1569 domain-containing protein [Leptospiraceae bacterium]